MTERNRDGVEARLSRFWDGVVRERPSPRNGHALESDLEATVHRLHALDQVPAPDPALATHVWEELMAASETAAATMNGEAAIATVPAHHRPHARVGSAPTPRRWPRLAELATAAIVLLTLAMGVLVYRADGPPPVRLNPVGLASPGATQAPPATPPPPRPEDCQVEPRSLASLRRLNEQAAALDADELSEVPVLSPPVAPPAPAAVVTAIDATYRQLSACQLANDSLRVSALFTDRWLVRSLAEAGPPTEAELLALATPQSVPDGEPIGIYGPVPAEDIVILPDGRVGALSPRLEGGLFEHDPLYREFLIFTEVDGRYLIDERVTVAPSATPTSSPGDVILTATLEPDREIAALEATVAALSTEVAAAETDTGEVLQLAPTPHNLIIQVDPGDLSRADVSAEAAVVADVRRLFAPYAASGCQLGFMFIAANAPEIGEGVELAQAVERLLRREFPDIFQGVPAELFAQPGVEPRGQVDLQLFFGRGCDPEEPAATPAR